MRYLYLAEFSSESAEFAFMGALVGIRTGFSGGLP